MRVIWSFHHSLISTDPNLGYKNDIDMLKLYDEAGLIHLSTENMPANKFSLYTAKTLNRFFSLQGFYRSIVVGLQD